MLAHSGEEALKAVLQRRLRRHPARRQHARHGRLRDGRADPQAQEVGPHADHLRDGVYRRDAHDRGLCARRGRFHLDAGRADDPAGQGEGVRRSVPDDAAGSPACSAGDRPGRRTLAACRRGRGQPPLRLSAQGRWRHLPFARSAGDDREYPSGSRAGTRGLGGPRAMRARRMAGSRGTGRLAASRAHRVHGLVPPAR